MEHTENKGKEGLSPKVKALYGAVLDLIGEDMDMRNVKVSDITCRAGIGKGTAYEYFNNKEEIISSALLYHINAICSQTMEEIRDMGDFHSMLRYLFLCMDREIEKRDCLVQFLHLVTDNSPVGRVMQEKMHGKNPETCMPMDVIDYMVQTGIRQGAIGDGLPAVYVNFALLSKLLMYAMYIAAEKKGENVLGDDGDNAAAETIDRERMHGLLCEGLLRELKGRSECFPHLPTNIPFQAEPLPEIKK